MSSIVPRPNHSLGPARPAAPRRPRVNSLNRETRPARYVLWASAVCVGAFVAWASYAEIDQITRAPGQVIASSRTQVIQTADGGVLEEMFVKEGDRVQQHQLLARIDRTKAEAAYLEARAKMVAVAAAVARLRAEVFGGEPQFPPEIKDYPQFRSNQLALLAKRRSALNEEIGAMQKMLELAQRELEMIEPLLQTGDASKAEVLKLQRQVTEGRAQIANKQNKYFQDTQAELSKAEEDLAGLQQALTQRKDLLNNTELRAPVNGTVKNVKFTTRGGVMRPGDEVMQIVPADDDLIFEAKVRPADIGFLKNGLPASIKVDAYDYTVYGSLQGSVSYISADTFNEDTRQAQGEQSYYRVQVRTDSPNFSSRPQERLALQPGMTATVEIHTGSNTVLRYLFKPVIKTMNESLNER